MRRGIVEGEPGIFPAPVARVLARVNRWARAAPQSGKRWIRRRFYRRGRQIAPGSSPPGEGRPDDEGGLGRDDRYG